MGYSGRAISGRNNDRLVQGRGRYAADVFRPGQCWISLVRSPHAHAKIVEINSAAALSLPGVVAVITGKDIAEDTKPYSFMLPPDVGLNEADMKGKQLRKYVLATDWIGYSGQPIIAVVAESPQIAARGVELVDVTYEPLPVVSNIEDALTPGSPSAIPGWPSNLLFQTTYLRGSPPAAFERAENVLRGAVKVQRHVPVPLEPRAYVAEYDHREDRLTVWASTQMPHTLRSLLAGCLDLDSEKVHIIQPNVGGAFGAKTPGSDEEVLVAVLARRLRRPMCWIEERSEYFLAGGHARETFFDFEVGYLSDGRISGLKVDITADVGQPQGAWIQSFVTAYCVPGAYVVNDCEVRVRSVVTNKCRWAGYRGFGKEAAAYFMDKVLDRIADATGLDRVDVRLKNFIPVDAFPYDQVSGAMIDSGNYHGAIHKLLGLIDLNKFREEQMTARAVGRFLGIGFGFEVAPEGCSMPNSDMLQGWDGTTVRIDPRGRVTVLTGVTSPGSGNETGITQIVADALGVPLDAVNVVQGDTDICPYGLGNFSSRSTMIGGSAALLAAQEIRKKLFTVAGRLMQAQPEELEAAEGKIYVRSTPDRHMLIRHVARAIYGGAFAPHMEGIEPGLEATKYFRIGNVYHERKDEGRFSPYPTWPFMATAAIVEVDRESGFVDVLRIFAVHDCGTIINPLLVDAQIHGAVAQGLGGALYEELVYDDEGQLLTTTLADYTMPTAVEMPSAFSLGHQETPTFATPLGAKGAGETGVGSTMSAVSGAVEDALNIPGLALMDLPLKPQRVWSAIREAERHA
jgi:aerobic carbon-monoxide dehydrogenase large subunit